MSNETNSTQEDNVDVFEFIKCQEKLNKLHKINEFLKVNKSF